MKQPTIIHELYNGQIKIEFRPNPFHTYKLLGENTKLTSVTSVTGLIGFPRDVAMRWAIGLAKDHISSFLAERGDMIDKAELTGVVQEAMAQYTVKRDEAASKGELVHAYAESYAQAKIRGQAMPVIGEDLPDEVISGINGFLDFINQHKVKFLEVERLVYSRKWGYAGLFDALIEIDGKKILADWKTSSGRYPEMNAQVAAYRAAYEEEMGVTLDGSMIVRFDKESGAFEAHDIGATHDQDAALFQALLFTKNRIKQIEYEAKN